MNQIAVQAIRDGLLTTTTAAIVFAIFTICMFTMQLILAYYIKTKLLEVKSTLEKQKEEHVLAFIKKFDIAKETWPIVASLANLATSHPESLSHDSRGKLYSTMVTLRQNLLDHSIYWDDETNECISNFYSLISASAASSKQIDIVQLEEYVQKIRNSIQRFTCVR